MAGKAIFDPQAGATFLQCVLESEDNMVTKSPLLACYGTGPHDNDSYPILNIQS